MAHVIYIIFLFAVGSCVGSFLNVVVWRLPRVEPVQGEGIFRAFYRSLVALSEPPSHCPKCNKLLKWYDNIPVLGWIKLGGRCRYCKQTISKRYPIIEAITGLIFVGYYVAFFIAQVGPCLGIGAEGHVLYRQLFLADEWPIYFLDMALLSGLLAASLIDAELFLIPMEIPWLLALMGVAGHTAFDTQILAGNVMAGPTPAAMALGATLGVIVSGVLLARGMLPLSFADGAPLLEIEREQQKRDSISGKAKSAGSNSAAGADVAAMAEPREWSAEEVRREIRKEMLFLMPPLFLALLFSMLAWKGGPVARWWAPIAGQRWVGALLGSLLGAWVGGFVVWLTRILGSLAFGREAMGMGDVDLMVGVGAVLGAGAATIAFFLAPFFGIVLAVYMLLTGKKRELPYGPYLSLASALVILFYGPIADYFAPGLSNLAWMARNLVGGQ